MHELILGGVRSGKSAAALAPAAGAAQVQALMVELTQVLRAAPGPVVLVSNEMGLGVTPLGADTRQFLDALGQLHQRAAACCARVTLMVADCEVAVKGPAR